MLSYQFDFERFRREFLVSISRDFLNLVVQLRAIANAEEQLQIFLKFQERAKDMVESGREPAFQRSLATQDVLFSQDSLRSQRETYQLKLFRPGAMQLVALVSGTMGRSTRRHLSGRALMSSWAFLEGFGWSTTILS